MMTALSIDEKSAVLPIDSTVIDLIGTQLLLSIFLDKVNGGEALEVRYGV